MFYSVPRFVSGKFFSFSGFRLVTCWSDSLVDHCLLVHLLQSDVLVHSLACRKIKYNVREAVFNSEATRFLSELRGLEAQHNTNKQTKTPVQGLEKTTKVSLRTQTKTPVRGLENKSCTTKSARGLDRTKVCLWGVGVEWLMRPTQEFDCCLQSLHTCATAVSWGQVVLDPNPCSVTRGSQQKMTKTQGQFPHKITRCSWTAAKKKK